MLSARLTRARDAEARGDGHISGALDQIPEAVVVALLLAAVDGMDPIIGRFIT
jgi:hypothetical protein